MKRKIFTVILAFFCIQISILTEAFPQDYNALLNKKPFIKNFSKSTYKAANQNWSITQDSSGIIYLGNTYGMLEYNGSSWKLHELSDNITIRSVYSDYDGKIYSGAHEEFGYWQRDIYGNLNYTSLSKKLKESFKFENEDIWKITRIKDKIYFQSFARIYTWDGKNVKYIDPDSSVYTIFKFKNRLYTYLMEEGLFYLTNKAKLKEHVLPEYLSNNVKSILSVGLDSILIVTEFNGVYIEIKNKWQRWNSIANEFLKKCHINNVTEIDKDHLAFGTIGHGIIIVTKSGNIKTIINKETGLQNNTILGILVDKRKNLWVAMDKGIDFVETNPLYAHFQDTKGVFGSVYCAALHKEHLFIGTNHGLFYTKYSSKKNIPSTIDLKFINGTQGQVWSLKAIGDRLICGHNEGTYEIRNNQVISISSKTGGNEMVKHPFKNSLYYQGTYTGIAVFEKNNTGVLRFKQMLMNTIEPIRYLNFDNEGDLWASHIYKGLFLFKLDTSATEIIAQKIFNKKDGFHSNYFINSFKVNNRIVFSNKGSFFTYDYLNEKIVSYDKFCNQLSNFCNSHRIIKVGIDEYWFLNKESVGMFKQHNDSLELITELSYEDFYATSVDGAENIWKLNTNYYLIGLDDGFVIYQDKRLNEFKKYIESKIKINRIIGYSTNKDETSFPINEGAKILIPYSSNNIRFELSIPGIVKKHTSFQYKLNESNSWIDIGEHTSVNFNSLKWGKYTFSFRKKSKLSDAVITQIKLQILPPWYAHPFAYIVYGLVLVLLTFVAWKFYKIKLYRQKLQYLKKMKFENEERIIKSKNEQLKHELGSQLREVANYALLLGRRNEVLLNLKEELNKENIGHSKVASLLRLKVIKTINKNLAKNDEWEKFTTHFNKANEDFQKALKKRHPELTHSDLSFSSFLRMNLSSKEIADLLNISTKSVEVKRYRLRKKLNLNSNQNLVNFMIEF